MWPCDISHNWQEFTSQLPAAAWLMNSEDYLQHQSLVPNNFASNHALSLTEQNILPLQPGYPTFLSTDSAPARADATTMSGTSQTAKIGLDARAAELKEKLLRSRSQSRPRLNPDPPKADPAKASTNASALTPSGTSALSLRGPSSELATNPPTPFVPHDIPRQPAVTSVAADADDIAALISSISSSAGEIPGLSINTPNSENPNPQPQQVKPANGQASLAPKLSPEIPVPNPAKLAPPELQVANQRKQSNNEATVLENSPSKGRSSDGSSIEEGEITSSAQKNSKPTNSDKMTLRNTAAPVHDVPTSSTASNSLPEVAHGKTDQTPSKPSTHHAARPDNGISRISVPKPAARTSDTARLSGPGKDGNGERAVANSVQKPINSAPDLVTPDDAMKRLLSHVPDLKDWLELTEYYNVETRARKLDRFRRVKALAAEKMRIEEEERRLMEEEELEMGLQRSAVARLARAASGAPGGSDNTNLPTPVTPSMISETKDMTLVTPAKRSHDENDNEARKEKLPRLEEGPPSSKAADNTSREIDRRDAGSNPRLDSRSDKVDSRLPPPSRGPSPYRRQHPPSPPRRDSFRSPPPRSREYSPHRQPRPAPRFRSEYDDYHDRARRYDRYRSDGAHYMDSQRRKGSGQHPALPVRVDLGRKGDSRFFIMKSFNEENVLRCMEDGIWTTQVQNGEVLTAAFAKCKNVILFFSINKSRAFQGYARMVSAPSPDTPRPKWMNGIHWETTDPFRVQWLSKTPVEFFRIGHLKNPYNEGRPVLVGKDGQEIEEECGAELLREMELVAEGQLDPMHPRRDSGGIGGGYGAKGSVKREGTPERR
ncbi:hypothetical protein VTK56DRAFT_8441 [Thermocarpiscus australiensis]